MCWRCGDCAAGEHGYSLDKAVDAGEASPAKSYIQQ